MFNYLEEVKYSSNTHNKLFIVTLIEGEPLKELRSRILVVTPTDFKTSHKYVKNLSKIVVSPAE